MASAACRCLHRSGWTFNDNFLYFFFTTKQYDGKVDDILAFVRGSKDKYEFLDKIDQLKDKFEIE